MQVFSVYTIKHISVYIDGFPKKWKINILPRQDFLIMTNQQPTFRVFDDMSNHKKIEPERLSHFEVI